MNIRAIWTDPEYSFPRSELVHIIKIEWMNGLPGAWVVNEQGRIDQRYLKDLKVIDEEYMS
jgi:hypothetical protein